MIPLSSITSSATKRVFRVVESQESVATMRLVDTLEEHALLEDIIENAKPVLPPHADQAHRHYLLKTPFRYPPLKYGSRFGRRFEPSLFYASHQLRSALLESAFYSFYFMSRSDTPFLGSINNKKTSFSAMVSTQRYANLCLLEDDETQAALQNKSDYSYTQRIGQFLRNENIDAFSYYSARESNAKHIAVFYLNAIKGEPENELHWEVKQTPERIIFYCSANTKLNTQFELQQFTVDGKLPRPSE
ncbi:RES family NAD+ phosphorylase [Glaciecola sp. MH2013]|uniref:RES family NAD+ phosphorylase n=1 Tax=Glaciecola sp. MH2013 TaxID=2785524 RepID=UPI00189DEC14|nr:RES family NAD+ phosphorylase [Glaciecola sp. MH2013]MBF7073988.1 RES family NAD+ phosphorylase [Glaciecola sp. MH2013]